MSLASRRSVGTAQLKLREMIVSIAGTGANTVSGFDQYLVDSVVDLGAGNYTIIFKGKAIARRALVLKGFSSSTADCTVQVTASDVDRITIQCRVAGLAADADVTLCIAASDWHIDYGA